MPPKVSLVTEEHSDDEELATVEGDHDDDDDEVDDDESDTSRGDESSSHDPRLSLATTATMSTFITETDVSTESDSDEDAPKRHRPRRLVSPIAALLLPRSSRHALSCAVGLILITMCCATVASLSLMDNYFTGIATQFTLTLTDMQSVDTEATLAAVEATFAAAAVSGGDDTLVQRFVSTAAMLSAAVQTTLLGAGVGEDSANLSDRSFASFWNGVRAAASTTPPTIGADLLECVNSSVAAAQLELQRLQQRRIANVAAYTTPTKLGDLVIAALGAVAGIDTGLVGVSDIDLATAAARSNTPSWTVAAVTGVVQPVELNTALAAGLFYSTADAGTQLPVLNALLPLSSAAQLVSPTSGASSDQVGLDPTTVQRAVVTYQWIITANTTLGRLSSVINALNANVKTIPTTVTPLATALLNASVTLSALASAVDASSTANGVSPALAAWFSTMPLRAAAYGFNDTALALLSVQGLDMPAQSKFPWLLGQISSNQSRVAAWFGAPPAQPTGATCVASLGNVASQSNATAQWMKGALLTYSNGILSGVEDSDLTRPARRGLIATLVVCMAGVVVISLYGQWGVATRLSSSTLPYRSFVSLWWVSSLLLMGCIAWVTGLGLTECDVSDPRNLPRAAYSQPQAAQYKSSKAWTAEIFNAMTTVFSWTSTPTYVQLNTARATASDVPRPTAAFSFLRSVVEPFVGNATGGDPYSPQQVWSSLAEDDLLLEPTIQYVLRTGAPVSQSWLPPTMAASATGNSTSRGTSACALAFAARAVRLSWLLSTNVGAATVSAPTYAPTATSAAVQRARALAINWPNLDAAFTGVHQQRCLGVGNVADQAGLVQAAGVVDSVVTRGSQRFGVLASAQVDATGRVLWSQLSAALPLRNILVQQDAVTSQALNVLTQGLDSNFTSTVSGMVDSTLQRAVPLKRRVVWGHIGVCVCAQLIVLGLWRLLFGVSPTPF